MTKLADLHKEWMKDPEYRAEYEATQPAFDLMRALIGARANSGLTQQEISERMGTTQSSVARLEGWGVESFCEHFAEVCGGDGYAVED